MSGIEELTAAEARRMTLAAQGFGRPHPSSVGTRQFNLVLERLGVLQIDSVNVFERSHYLPLYARLGGYDRALLDRLLLSTRHGYIEYLPHVACFMPVSMWPLFRWRMDAYREKHRRQDAWVTSHQSMLDWLRSELAARGPLAASEIEHESNVRRGPWWGWSDIKEGLEYLFWWGEVASAGRIRFERRYALAEHIIPEAIRSIEIARPDAIRELLRRAVVSSGVGTLRDFGDYYRLKGPEVAQAAAELEESGDLIPVRVEGWDRNGRPLKAWRHRDARLPRRITGGALLSPFDPVVWERGRTERMFGFRYRIEIYVPQPRRVFGYYVLPVLIDDAIVGRLDLKSDRQAGVLRVQAAWSEGGSGHEHVERIAALLRSAAGWQGLEGAVVVEDRGNLAASLRAAVD